LIRQPQETVMNSSWWIGIALVVFFIFALVVLFYVIADTIRKRREGAASPLIGQPRETKMSPAMRISLGVAVILFIVLRVAPTVVGPIVARHKLGPKGQELSKAEVVGWGAAYDPDGDCSIEGKGTTLSLKVPGTLHDLSVEQAQVNAARVLRPVEGDFVAEVKVVGQVSPQGVPTSSYALPYHGAGLLLWLDRDNYIRLERAAILRDDGMLPYVNFEKRASATMHTTLGEPTPDGPLALRLTRHGPNLSAAYRIEGQNWIELRQEVSLRGWGDALHVGVAAINTASAPFTAEFADFRVDKQP